MWSELRVKFVRNQVRQLIAILNWGGYFHTSNPIIIHLLIKILHSIACNKSPEHLL
jgi:hypothetical protein